MSGAEGRRRPAVCGVATGPPPARHAYARHWTPAPAKKMRKRCLGGRTPASAAPNAAAA